LWTTTIKWGNFTLTRDQNFASTVNAGWGYSDVVIAKGTFKANQAVKYEDGFTLTTKSNNVVLKDILRKATLIIGSRNYQLNITGNKLETESEIFVDKGSHDVRLEVSLINDGVGNELALNDIEGDCFKGWKYINTDETPVSSLSAAGAVRVAKISISQQMMWFKKVGPSDDVKVAAGVTDERLLL
jgi:hypothetical protein